MIASVGMSVDGRSGPHSVCIPGFPSLAWKTRREPDDVVVSLSSWLRPDLDLSLFDARIDEIPWDEGHALWLEAGSEREAACALQVLTRCQRLFARRNEESAGEDFTRALGLHRGLHDTAAPLVRADLDHALDTWQWLLRLRPGASGAAQLAALFHDVARLESERDEGDAAGTLDPAGASFARKVLEEAGVPRAVRERAASLIAGHGRPPGDDPEARVLSDADVLSFFSLKSGGYLDAFGEERTRAKAAQGLSRLSPSERGRPAGIRMRPEIARMVDELAGTPVSSQ